MKEDTIHGLERRSDFEAVFHASPDPILLVGTEGIIRDANPQAEIMFGWSRDEMVGELVEMLVPRALRDAHRQHRSEYGRHPVPRPMGLGMELNAVGKDGFEFPVEISLGPSVNRSGTLLVVCVVRSLAGSKVLRRVSAARIAAAESERKRIAGELHDSVKQGLTAIQLHLAALVEMRLAPEEAAVMVTDVQNELDLCHDSLDRAIRDLMPVELEGHALEFALNLLCRRAEGEGFAVERDIRWSGDALDGEACLAVFRIVQEGLNNAKRHKRCRDRHRQVLALGPPDPGRSQRLRRGLLARRSGAASGGWTRDHAGAQPDHRRPTHRGERTRHRDVRPARSAPSRQSAVNDG